MMAAASIEHLDDDGLARIEPEWVALWKHCRATPFQHPAWLLPWADIYAPGRAGGVALRCGGRLAGLAAVFEWRGALLLAGTGPSDHGDWLLEPGLEGQSARLLEAICERGDRIELRQMPPGSALATVPAPPSWRSGSGEDEPCLVACLAGEDGLGAATKKCRQNWSYAMRRIARAGGAVELVPPGEVAGGMDDLARLHARRWEERGETGVLADPLLDALLRDAAPGLERAGLLRLSRVRIGGRVVAVLLVLAGNGAHHYYIGGFDPDFGGLSPSAALVGAAMAQAAREGATAFDFLRGAEPYKTRWGAVPQPTLRRTLSRGA